MNSAELIARLEVLSTAYTAAALVVVFPDRTSFVFAYHEDKSETLGLLLEAGGTAVAFLCVERQGQQLEVTSAPLPEFENAPGVQEYLRTLVDRITAELAQDGIARRVWLQ